MKFQHLILPVVLWLSVGLIIAYIPPESPLIIGGILVILSLALYFSVRLFTHTNTPIILTCCVVLFLLSSMLSGFSIINFLLIAAIGTLISILISV